MAEAFWTKRSAARRANSVSGRNSSIVTHPPMAFSASTCHVAGLVGLDYCPAVSLHSAHFIASDPQFEQLPPTRSRSAPLLIPPSSGSADWLCLSEYASRWAVQAKARFSERRTSSSVTPRELAFSTRPPCPGSTPPVGFIVRDGSAGRLSLVPRALWFGFAVS